MVESAANQPGACRGSALPSRRPTVRLKRILDVVLATAGLVALAPLMGVVAVAIRLTMGRPVLFRQRRPGYRERPFELVKFRSLLDEFDPQGRQRRVTDRITRLGSALRQTSMDELPELWNVLRGDMSFVGPRPLLMEYLPLYTPEQARRHHVRPGLTGLAQIRGRHSVPWEERFRLDVWYVDNWSLRLDLRILASTLRYLADGSGHLPAELEQVEFKGSDTA